MNLKRFLLLALGTYGLCALWAITGVQSTTVTLTVPPVPQTVTLGMLTPQQLEDRAEELTTTTTSTSTLGRLLWKETRCLNITPLSTDPELAKRFNNSDHGIAQVNEIHTKYVEQVFNMPFAEAMSDPTLNLRFAYLLYSDIAEGGGCGWKPWKLC